MKRRVRGQHSAKSAKGHTIHELSRKMERSLYQPDVARVCEVNLKTREKPNLGDGRSSGFLNIG